MGVDLGIDGSGYLTGAAATGADMVNDGAWHHVALSYDGTDVQLFVDGIASGAPVAAALDLTSGDITFGRSLDGSSFFKGVVDDIRIWSTPRTAQDIADNYQRTELTGDVSSLEARYTLDNPESDDIDANPGLIDVSGNGHALSAGGPPNDGFAGYLVLDGSGDYVSFPDFNSVAGTGSLTVTAWVRADALSGTQNLITLGDTAVVLSGNTVGLVAGGVGPTLGDTVTAGEWVHVAAVYDGDADTAVVYVNGQAATPTGSVTATITDPTEIIIGAGGGGANAFDGAITQVRIFSEARALGDIQSDMDLPYYDGNSPATLVNSFPLNGSLENDQGHQNNQSLADGTFADGAHFADVSPTLLGPNVLSGAVSFNGAEGVPGDDALSFGQHPVFQVPSSLTLEAWIKPTAIQSDWDGIVGNLADTDAVEHSGYGLHLSTGNVVRFAFVVNDVIQIVDTPINAIDLNQWSHVAATYDGTTARIFVNGEEVASEPVSGVIEYTPTNDLRIGAMVDSNENHYFNGQIADVRIWDVARTEWEIEDGAEHPIPVDSAGLIFNAPLNGADGAPVSTVTDIIGGLTGTATGNPVYVDTAPDIYGDASPASPLLAQEDTAFHGQLAAADVDGDSVTFTLNAQAQNGTVTVNPDGTFQYLSAPNYSGLDAFTVSVSDGFGGTATQTINLEVQPANDAPIITSVTTTGDGMQFDGVDDVVVTGLNSMPTNFTIEAHIRTGNDTADGFAKPIISRQPGTVNDQADFDLQINGDGTLVFVMGQGAGSLLVVGPILTSATDYHLAVTFDDSTGEATIYVDGEEAGLGIFSGTRQTGPANVEIGHYTETSGSPTEHYYDGLISDVRIYDTVLDAAQIQNDMGGFVPNDPNAAGLLVHYDFENLVGQTVTNLGSATGADGQLGSTASANADDPTPVPFAGRAMVFDGVDDVIRVPDEAAFDIENQITLQTWFKLDAGAVAGTNYGLIEKFSSAGSDRAYQLTLTDGNADGIFNLTFQLSSDGAIGPILTVPNIVTRGEWAHATATFDGTTMRLYLNGEEVGSDAGFAGQTIHNSSADLAIGGNFESGVLGRPFKGEMFDARIYNVGRTDAAIQSDIHTLPTGDEAGLVAAWPLTGSDGATVPEIVAGADGTFESAAVPATPTFDATNPLITAEDATLTGQVTVADIDGDTDFDFGITGHPMNGDVWIDNTGQWQYTPNANFHGADSFEVSVRDHDGGVATQTVTVDVKPINDAPVVLGARAAGSALQFDGVNDSVSVVPSGGLTLGSHTFEAWIESTNTNTDRNLFVTDDGNGADSFANFFINFNEGLTVSIQTSPGNVTTISTTSPHALVDGFMHVGYTFDQETGDIQIFVDGTPVAMNAPSVTGDISGGEIAVDTYSLGANEALGSAYYKGQMDDVRLWGDVRMPGEIAGNMNIPVPADPTDLIAHYGFDDVFGTTVPNLVAGGPDAQLGDGVDPATEPMVLGPNVIGRALDFSGSSKAVGDIAADVLTDQVTIEMNIRFDSLTGQQNLVDLRSPGGTPDGAPRLVPYKVNSIDGTHPNEFALAFIDSAGNNTTVFTSATAEADVWYHVAVTYDGATARLYVDGVEVGSQAFSNFSYDAATPVTLTMGANGNALFPVDGQISDVRVWDVARSASDIADNMNTFVDANDPNLIANYRMDDAASGTPATIVDAVNGSIATVTGTGTVTFVNTAPDIFSTVVTTPAGAAVRGDLAAFDVEGDSISFTPTAGPQSTTKGMFEVFADGTYEYIPDQGATGLDSFQVTLTEIGSGLTSTQTITVDVVPDLIPLSHDQSADALWENTANWGGALPTAINLAVLADGTDTSVTLSSDGGTVGGLDMIDTGLTLDDAASALVVDGALTLGTGQTLSLSAADGSLTVNGDAALHGNLSMTAAATLTVNGQALMSPTGIHDWMDGTLAGTGAITYSGNAALNLSTPGLKTIDGVDITASGAGVDVTFALGVANVTLNNDAVLTIDSGATLHLDNNGTLADGGTGTNTLVIGAGGTLIRDTASGTNTIATDLSLNGALDVETGTLKLQGGADLNGNMVLASGATLELAGTSAPIYSIGPSGDLMGLGTLLLSAPTATLNIDSNLIVDSGLTLAQADGTINVLTARTLAVEGTHDWTGGTITGTGTVSYTAGGTLNVNGDVTFDGIDASITGVGTTVNMTGDHDLQLSNDTIVTVGADGLFAILGTGDITSGAETTGNELIISAGATLQKIGNSGPAFINVELTLDGTLQVDQGNLQLADGGMLNGDVNIAAGAQLRLDGTATYTVGTGLDLAGNGTLALVGGGVVVAVDNDLIIDSALTLQQDFGSLDIAGAQTLTIEGTHNWVGGEISGAGSVNVTSTGVTNIEGGVILNGAALTVGGTLTVNGDDGGVDPNQNVKVQNGSSINVIAGGLVELTNTRGFIDGGGAGTFSIAAGATLRKSGTGEGEVNLTLNNAGDIEVTGGILTLDAAGTATNTGIITIAEGATLRIENGTLSNYGTIEGDGQIEFATGGSLINQGTLEVGGLENIGDFTVQGTIDSAGSSNAIAFEFEDAASYDQLTAADIDLSGSTDELILDFTGIDVAAGDVFDIITFASGTHSTSDQFDIITTHGLYGYQASVFASATGVTVTISEDLNYVIGTGGNDTLFGSAGADLINSGAGNDSLFGGNANDRLQGGTDNDYLDGGTGQNILIGGDGDDTLTGDTRGFGGIDLNTAAYGSATAAITVTLDGAGGTATSLGGGNAAAIGTDTLIHVDRIIGSDFDDQFVITGTWMGGQFDAYQGSSVGQFNIIQGGAGDDTITGNGFTRVDYSDALDGVTVTFTADGVGTGRRTDNAGSATGVDDGTGLDSFTGVGDVMGSHFDDVITGDGLNNSFAGLAGNDTLDGGAGTDRADYRTADGAITVDMTLGSGQVTDDGYGDVDTLIDIEYIRGSRYDDVMIANDAGGVQFRGEDGDDTITGGLGIDTVRGGAGNDVITGGGGADDLRSDDGRDRFVYNSITDSPYMGAFDRIRDFNPGNDKIEFAESLLSGIFTYVGGGSLTGGGDSSARYNDSNSHLEIDTDGDGAPDMEIRMDGVTAADLSINDFRITISDTGGIDTLTGGATSDLLRGLSGDDILDGGDGDDVLVGGGGNDTLTGGAGFNILRGGAGDDTFHGIVTSVNSTDINTIDYRDATDAITVTLDSTSTVTGDASVGTDTIIGADRIFGSEFGDTFNIYAGWSGSQHQPFGGALGQFMEIDGGGGDDTIYGNGFTRIGFGNATDGVRIEFTGAGMGTSASIHVGDAAGVGIDTFSGVNGVRGSEYDDWVTGSVNNEEFRMQGGNDYIDGGGGIDTVRYDAGGASVNLSSYTYTVAGASYASIAAGTAFDGEGGTDTLINIENARGSANGDVLIGSDDDNELRGDSGQDTFLGGLGADTIRMGSGDGVLDNAVYQSKFDSTQAQMDTIREFEDGVDHITFQGIDFATLTPVDLGFQTDVSTGIAAATTPNSIHFFNDGTHGYVYVNGAGSGTDFDGTLIKLQNVTTAPSASTFANDVLFTVDLGGATVTGTAGNDSLTGTIGDDVFEASTGTDVITDVTVGGTDQLDLGLGFELVGGELVGSDLMLTIEDVSNQTLHTTTIVNHTAGNTVTEIRLTPMKTTHPTSTPWRPASTVPATSLTPCWPAPPARIPYRPGRATTSSSATPVMMSSTAARAPTD